MTPQPRASMSLLTRLREAILPSRSVTPTFQNFDDLWRYLNFNGNHYPLGLTQTLQGNREEIDASFAGIVQQAYGGNGIVFAVELARFMLFSEARFQYQRIRGGRPGELYGTNELAILENPWPGGVTGDLLTSALLDADIAGNAFIARRDADRGRLRRLRPDWVTIIMGSDRDPDVEAGDLDAEVIGYMYQPGGKGGRQPVFLQATEVAHFRPIPDPIAAFRGMSWLTPVLREIQGDSAMTAHKNLFLEQGATPNMVVVLDKDLPPQSYTDFVDLFKQHEPKGRDAYRTMYLGGGADAKLVGSDLKQLDFKVVQGAGETRIAAAGGVPPVIAGFSEGLQAATYSNYSQARRRFVDGTIRPLWRNFAGSMQTIIPTPTDSRLWYDDRDIAFLREDAKDRADIQGTEARTIQVLWNSGYEPDAIIDAVMAEDWGRLVGKHSGLAPVQAQPEAAPPPATPDPVPPPPARDAGLWRLVDAAERRALMAENRPDPVINVTTAPVTVNTPENPVTVTIERGAVEVSAPVTIEPAVVNVHTPEVRNEITVEPTPVAITNEVSVEPTPVEIRNDVTVEPTLVQVTNEVSVEPTPVQITNEVPEQRSEVVVNLPAGPAPVVNVSTPSELRITEMPARVTRRKVTRRTDTGAIAETEDLERDV